MSVVHIIGAGISGVAAGTEIARRGIKVNLYESAAQAGGRCRSFYDHTLDRYIDNGNHLMLGANPALFFYLDTVNGRDGLICNGVTEFPFIDIKSGMRWTLRPNKSIIPWWILSPSRRVPGSSWPHYLSALKLLWCSNDDTVADCMDISNPLMSRLWEPITVAILNAPVAEASAKLLWPVIKLTFGQGEKGSRPYVAKRGLTEDLVDPGIRYIEKLGGKIYLNKRLREITTVNNEIRSLKFTSETININSEDKVILAVPPQIAFELVPDISVPLGTRTIINAHFRLESPIQLPGGNPLLGIVGGQAQWLFVRNDIASVTVSAADDLAKLESNELAKVLWNDTAIALELSQPNIPLVRIIKEKRATFAQTPENVKQRPECITQYNNLFLAGDWTNTGLPATIEGAIVSGHKAARIALD